MKNKGFTLIELLAVIVVLGALALITVPIVTSSITKSQQSADTRKVEIYAKSINQAILDKQIDEDFIIEDGCYNVNNSGNLCLNDSCTSILEITAKNKPKSGTVCMQDKKISSITMNDKLYEYDETDTLVLIKTYTVTFNTNGGTEISSQIVHDGETVKKPKNPYKQGYKVKEWQLKGNTYNFDTPVTKNITLTVLWEETPIYTLMTGENFNLAIKTLETGTLDQSLIYFPFSEIKRVEFYSNGELPEGYTLETLQALPSTVVSETGETIKAYYDDNDKNIFVYSDGEIAWNENRDFMFAEFTELEEFTIPSNVTRIGAHTFAGCSKLKEILIPSTVKTIDDYAFSASYNIGSTSYMSACGIENVIIENGITRIGKGVFYDCSSLKSINIPDSVTSIGDFAFSGCTSLTSVTIPSSVTIIGEEPFGACRKLESITIESGNPNYEDRGSNAIIEKATNTLLVGSKNTIIPNNIISIGDYAFSGRRITSITIPNSVTHIGNGAFLQSGLTSITIPSSVTSIGRGAFISCSSLTSVTFENPNGWWYSSSADATTGTSIDVSNPSTNATNLKGSYGIGRNYWKRS